MRIFISHSSKDKWAARRIAKDIEELGHEVFLDEKDIATGDSIDVSIRKHLKGCEHFLLLLSPASQNSAWVLVELGGAIALEKQIVPILLYVGANEVPQVINLKLARDINDIDKYYGELGGSPKPPKAATKATHPKKRPPKPTIEQFSIGDAVVVARNTPKEIIRGDDSVNIGWVDEMDKYLGKTGKVIEVDDEGDCTLDFAPRWRFAPEWLNGIVIKVA